MLNNWLLLFVIAVISYLLGSFSTGITVSRRKNINIRGEGSHNPGASNVMRVMGIRWGVITFVGDAAKAVLACLAGRLILPEGAFGIPDLGVLTAGLFTVLGHDWPVYYGFRGGKGVACSVAVAMFVDPLLGGISIGLCLLVMAMTRYISLGSLTLSLFFFLLNLFFRPGEWVKLLFCGILLALCVFRHRGNIGRLLRGEERKIGEKEQPKH